MQDRAKIYRALDGELGDFFKQKIHAETPYRVLGFWDNGFRHVTNRVRAIHTPHDCKGIRIRTQMSDFIGTVFRTIGFEPVAMDIKFFLEKNRHRRDRCSGKSFDHDLQFQGS